MSAQKNNVVPELSDELAYLLDTVQYYKEKFSYVSYEAAEDCDV